MLTAPDLVHSTTGQMTYPDAFIAKDLESLDREHRQFLSMFDHMEEVIYVADPVTHEVLYANEATRKQFGDCLGRKCYEVLQHEAAPCSFCTNPFVFGDNLGKTHTWEAQNQANRRWFRCIDRAIPWSDGRFVRFELAVDITEQKELESRLQKQNEALARSNRELDDFAYIASHDLREPLRGIGNYAAFLAEDYGGLLPAEGRAMLETLIRFCRREEMLIDALLHYSRLGRQELSLESVDPASVAAEAAEAVRAAYPDLQIDVRFATAMPVTCCDRLQLFEVFQNLIANGVKYNNRPRREIEIGCRPAGGENRAGRGPDGGPVVFFVRDNGIGIRPEHQERVFTIFKRLHGRDQYGGGAGAGLTIIKKVVERHGGRIWLESHPGQGTQFYFTLAELPHAP